MANTEAPKARPDEEEIAGETNHSIKTALSAGAIAEDRMGVSHSEAGLIAKAFGQAWERGHGRMGDYRPSQR